MKLSRKIIYISLLVAVVSLVLYLSSFPTFLITDEQANNILLALFGAAFPSAVVAIMKHNSDVLAAEEKLLHHAERIISGFVGLKNCTVELFGNLDDAACRGLIGDYFDEIESNFLPGGVFHDAESTVARDRLISAIENCELCECDQFAADEGSSSSRFRRRLSDSLRASVESFLSLANLFKVDGEPFRDTADSIAYLFLFGKSARKKKALDTFTGHLSGYEDEVGNVIGLCRLYNCDEASVAELFDALGKIEPAWCKAEKLEFHDSTYIADNVFANSLYQSISVFAEASNAPSAKRFRRAAWWWAEVDEQEHGEI